MARYFYKLMAYKDEYEVARLHSDPAFAAKIAAQFEGDYKLNFHLAPPLFSRIDPKTGKPAKIRFGSWMMPAFRFLARLRWLRGTALDPFGYSEERASERALVIQYEKVVDELLVGLSASNYGLAIEIARFPEGIRGYGHVKERHMTQAQASLASKLEYFRSGKTGLANNLTSNKDTLLA